MGGNAHNCLTWMDKMGTSVLAGNKGTPSTPRAGSPVELVGLLYYCLIKFDELSKQGLFKFLGVEAHGQYITFREWADKIKQNFDLYYFLKDICNYKDPFIRGIYKDLVNSPIHYD
jgi:glycogen debranching enzyme